MRACVEHARDLLASARAVQREGRPNIAYHLGALALEELGRRQLLVIKDMESHRVVPKAWPEKHTQDHVKKLFWCFFGGHFSAEQPSVDDFHAIQGLATRVHETRLEGLYVGVSADGISIPKDAISADETQRLLDAAEAKLAVVDAAGPPHPLTAEELELQRWFLNATEDKEQRRQIFSKTSMDKLTELKDVREWTRWLKELFDDAVDEARARAERVINEGKAAPEVGTKNRWRIRIRILSASHSIRPKVLTSWNKRVEWIKLSSNKKDELSVEFILQDNIPVQGLWWFGWGVARHFVAALNMGTMGFWWWRLPQDVSRYYDSIEDLEAKQRISLERSPTLKIDWGKDRTLTEEDLNRVVACFVALPGPHRMNEHGPYNYYAGGLTFLSLNDVHWQCEVQAFGNFFHCFKEMLIAAGDLNPGQPTVEAFGTFLDDMFPNMDDRQRYVEIGQSIEDGSAAASKITLSEVAAMKLFCDVYFQRTIRPKAFANLQASERLAGDDGSDRFVPRW